MPLDVLLVDPDIGPLITSIRHTLATVAEVELCTEFRVARARVLTNPPDFLVTNLRLQEYNGLHLVLFTDRTETRCIVYAAEHDFVLAREAQNLGAFYERQARLPFVLRSYVNAVLPERDRRDVLGLDRRLIFRGGRRCADLPDNPMWT